MITPTLVEPTENHEAGVASGVWSTQDQLEARRGGVWPEAGVANPDSLIESNFSTFLYDGTGAAQTITNGIDLSGKGGLVWIKSRGSTEAHFLFDSAKANGISSAVQANETGKETNLGTTGLHQFNSDGFTMGINVRVNGVSEGPYVSWSFKKAPKFFDVVTYSGTGSARTVAHSLGGTVGMILIKNLDQTDNWAVYHRGADGSAPEDKYLILDTTAAVADSAAWWNDTAPTTSVFTVGTDHAVNADGENYVAYIFAHETGDDSMIQCGSYTHPNDTSTVSVDLGWEPQWILFKANQDENWFIFDTMRGIVDGGLSGDGDAALFPNTTGAENVNTWGVDVKPTGFDVAGNNIGSGGNTIIYVAIRRPNMATITDATKVFNTTTGLGANPQWKPGFTVDFELYRRRTGTQLFHAGARLTGTNYLRTSGTDAQDSDSSLEWDYQDGFYSHTGYDNTYQAWMWKRAKGFFDVVCWNGTGGGAAQTVSHSLGVAPELVVMKARAGDADSAWQVLYKNGSQGRRINLQAADGGSNETITLGTSSFSTTQYANSANTTFVGYLFATLAGVSKVGIIAHSGSSTDVDCGFSAGARFVLLKRDDASGDWYIWDSVRGIIAGNDPYLLLNSTAAEVTNTDFIDPLASGFQISGDFTDGTYLFYAIA